MKLSRMKGENDTADYIYLLTIDEANALDINIRKCDNDWWLRSSGATSDDDYGNPEYYEALVLKNGNISFSAFAVRPALNLKF